jgi:hypothetical protein
MELLLHNHAVNLNEKIQRAVTETCTFQHFVVYRRPSFVAKTTGLHGMMTIST